MKCYVYFLNGYFSTIIVMGVSGNMRLSGLCVCNYLAYYVCGINCIEL